MDRGTKERVQIIASRGVPPTQAKLRASPMELDDHPLASPHETYGDFMIPILGILILHQVTFTSTAFATAAGTYHLRNVLARILIYTSWIGLWLTVWFAGVVRFLDVPVHIQVLPLISLSLLGLLGVCAMGISAGAILKHPLAALQVIPFTSYPFLFLSGVSWPREVMPDLAQRILHLIPACPWLLGANRAIRLDAGFADLRPEFLNLTILVVAWGLVAFLLTRWRDRQGQR